MEKFIFDDTIIKTMPLKSAIRTLTREFEMNYPRDLYRFYINIKRILLLYQTSYKDHFLVPLQDGGALEFSLCPKGCVLKQISFDNREHFIVDEEMLGSEEKKALLSIMNNISFNIEIGHRYPEKLVSLLKDDIQPNDYFSFSDGQSFLCIDKNDHEILLKRTCKEKDLTKITIDDFVKEDKSSLLQINFYHPRELQDFYNNVKSNTTGNVIPYLYSNGQNRINQFIDKIYYQLSKTNKKFVVLKIANETFHIINKQNKFLWYDKNKRLIPEQIAKAFLGWIKSSPMQINTIDNRKDVSDFEKRNTLYDFMDILQSKMQNGFSKEIVDCIYDFCSQNKEQVMVKLSGYIDENNYSHTAKSFSFHLKGENIKIYMGIHKNNDLTQDIINFVPCSLEQFYMFCETKMLRQKEVIKVKKAEEILKEYKKPLQVTSDTWENLINGIVENTPETYNPFQTEDISYLDKDISNLLDSYEG